MEPPAKSALAVLVASGPRLRNDLRFDWPAVADEIASRLSVESDAGLASLIALVGGASSGKSTVFNNLLDGHLASRVTARGHSTRGPILAVHHSRSALVERLIKSGRFFPGLKAQTVELDANATGEPGVLSLIVHSVDRWRNVLLMDLPDFTSEAARQEGDATLTLWPWFDRVVVVVDHERWFDRQSATVLRTQCARFAQPRYVLFNRTLETSLAESDRTTLEQQASRLGASGMTVLEFRRGRGLCLFPPGTLDEAATFISAEKPDRGSALESALADASNRVLNQNEERIARLASLRDSLEAALLRVVPSQQECMAGLMTSQERAQLDVVSRVLRLDATRDWFNDQVEKLQRTVQRLPMIGTILRGGTGLATQTAAGADRVSNGRNYVNVVAQRFSNEIRRIVCGSAFWDELRQWTGREPDPRSYALPPGHVDDAVPALEDFDRAMTHWNEKVAGECRGLSPYLAGAMSVGTVGLAIVLIAVPGPLAALTLVSAKGAIGAALSELLIAGGAGAVFGKHLGRLSAVVQERLVGSVELDGVLAATRAVRRRLEAVGRGMAARAQADAAGLVLPAHDPLYDALLSVCAAQEART